MERILLRSDWTTLLGCLNLDVAKKEQGRNGLYFFVVSARRKLMGVARTYASTYGTENSMKWS